jgi:hypothetical protein
LKSGKKPPLSFSTTPSHTKTVYKAFKGASTTKNSTQTQGVDRNSKVSAP